MSNDTPVAKAPTESSTGILMLLGNGSVGRRARRALTMYALGLEAWKLGKWLYQRWESTQTYKVSVMGDDAIYDDLQHWLLAQIPEKDRRALIARTQRQTDYIVDAPESASRPEPVTMKLYYDGSQSQAVVIGGHPVAVHIDGELAKANAQRESSNGYDKRWEKIVFTARGADGHAAVQAFIQQVTDDHYAVDKTPDLFISRWGSWESRRELGMRSLDRIFLADDDKDEIVEDLAIFLANEERYRELDLPWHRGYLFEGPPGTGKSSLAKALANHFGLDVYFLSLSTVYGDGELMALISRVPARSLLVLEDADIFHAMTQRNDEQGAGAVTMQGVLNNLDGLLTPHGLVFVLTSNEVGALDEAVVRKGRVDRKFHVGYMKLPQLNEMVASLLSIPDAFDSIAANVAPVDVVECVKSNLYDPQRALAAIKAIVAS